MQTKAVMFGEQLETITLDSRRYEVGSITREDLTALWGRFSILAGGMPAPLEERNRSQTVIAFALMRRHALSLTLEYVAKHLTVEDSVRAANEFARQVYLLTPVQGHA